MTPELFTVWLQGFVELNGGAMPSKEQWKSITEHLATVFNKVTPPVFPSIPNIMPTDPHKYPTNPYDPPLVIC